MYLLYIILWEYNYLQEGDRVVSSDCSEECTCFINGTERVMRCEELVCHEHAACERRVGVDDCYCNKGYEGDGSYCDGMCYSLVGLFLFQVLSLKQFSCLSILVLMYNIIL